MRVLLVSPPYAGHLNPLLEVGRHLSSRGALCSFVTGPAKLQACRDLGFDAAPVLADDPDAMERIANTERQVSRHPIRAYRQVRENLRFLPRALPDVQAAAEQVRPDVIVADFCAPVAGVVARRLGVPWVTTIPTPFAIENRRGTPAYCGGWTPRPGLVGTTRDALGRTATRGLKHLTGRLFRGELRPFGGSLYRHDGSEAFYSDRAIVAFGLAEFEFERDWPPVLRFVGPVTSSPGLDAPDRAPSRQLGTSPRAPADFDPLHHRPSVPTNAGITTRVLVTVGTHLPWAKESLVEQVATLAGRLPGFAFTVCLGDASAAGPPRQVADRVDVVPWLPYDSALPGFDAVLHHGGAGITYSTLRAGLPSVVGPQDYDQFDFAARLAHHGLGVRVRSLAQATAALPEALHLPREPLNRFARLVQASEPLLAVERVLTEATATGGG